MLVVSARPDLLERYPAWGAGWAGYSALTLPPLSPSESRRLLQAILCKLPQIPPLLEEVRMCRAAGNPFYVGELIKMLIDEGVIQIGADQWQVATERLAALHVPPTLTEVLQARLDTLTPSERTTLQRAAGIGETFWDRAVGCLAEQDGVGTQNLGAILGALWTNAGPSGRCT